MQHLRAIRLERPASEDESRFPWNIRALRNLPEIPFDAPVTFLVGENGSGKSTLLEGIAFAANMIVVGSETLMRDETLTEIRQLGDSLRLVWQRRTRKGFFLRAEDFFGYVKQLARMRSDLEGDIQRVDKEYASRSDFARGLARMAFARELHDMNQQYGRDLNSYSHGESFLELFQSRLVPGGLYLLDEPEVPLSPSRQLTLISMLRHMVGQECQFIIATHSPILMAFPGATILSFDESPVKPVAYEELEHVVITRSFLNDPDQYLRHL